MESFFAGAAGRWPAGRRDLHWHVLPGPPAAGLLAGQYRELTARPDLEPVRPEWLHITVHHGPPAAQLSTAQAARLAALVAEACAGIAPFAVTAGRAEAWHAGIVCPVRPGQPLRELHQVTAAAAARVTGTAAPGPDDYYPHLTLAYATGPADHRPLRAWLADSDAAEVPLPVTELALVAQRHDGRAITWELLDRVALAAGPPSPCLPGKEPARDA
jgi:2'-5' RNA ligase